MAKPVMPKATAVWLIDNTMLTFEQIAQFCGLHPLEVSAIADGDVAANILGKSPVVQGLTTPEMIAAAEANADSVLESTYADVPQATKRTKGPRYTPVTKRADKPAGIYYLIKTYPQLTDPQIVKLLGTTKHMIGLIRSRAYPGIATLAPQDPVQLGLCTRADFDAAMKKAEEVIARAQAKAAKEARKAAREAAIAAGETPVAETEDDKDAEQAA